MKKLLIIMCAALFVAAMVLPAAAADMSVSGYYRIRGFYQSNAGTLTTASNGTATGYGVTPWSGTTPYTSLGYGSSNAWWDHMLQLNPVFKVADNLKLVTQVSAFNNQMFGTNQTSGACVTSASTTSGCGTKNYNTNADNVLVNRAYIDWKTGYGTFKFGRQAAGVTFLPFANTTKDGDRIRWDSPAWNGFQLGAYAEKSNEQNATSGHNISSEDSDTYRIFATYTQPCYFLGYALDYGHDRTSSAHVAGGSKANTVTHNICVKANDPSKTFFFQGELQLLRGDSADYYTTGTDLDKDGMGYYAAVGMTKGPLTVAVATTFVSGDDNASDTNVETGSSFGLDFQPLYIVFSPYANILTSQSGGHGRCMTALDSITDTGAKAYAILADYAVNPQLALHAGFGAAYADKTSAGYNDEFGKEFDLGLKYQIMSNLAYELHAGYLWTGDFFKRGSTNNTTDDVYQIDHSLTLSF